MNNKIFSEVIKWEKHPTNTRYFYTHLNNKLILLRMNNFPDEQLFSLISELEIVDFEDAPENWEIPYE